MLPRPHTHSGTIFLRTQAAELDKLTSEVVSIHPSIHRRIIGFKGQTVKGLQETHNVRIEFPRDKDSPDITIIGLPDDVEYAREELLMLEEEYVSGWMGDLFFTGRRGTLLPRSHGLSTEPLPPHSHTFPCSLFNLSACVSFPLPLLIFSLFFLCVSTQIDEIREIEETQRYIKPTREPEKEEKKPSGPFKVRDAPWEMAKESFPTLGGGAGGSSAPKGAWGRAK